MRIAIFGVGGAAGYFGARLAQAGEDVSFVARGDHLHAIRQHGLQVKSPLGDVTVQPAVASDNPSDIGPVDVVILGVKTWQVTESAKAIKPLMGSRTTILPIQNGVEASQQLADVLGKEHVLGGLAAIISYIVAPGQLHHEGGPTSVSLAELDNHPSERVERLRASLEQAGIGVIIPSDIHAAIWSKFLLVTSFGGLGAITRAPAAVIRRLPGTRVMLELAMREVLALATARGISLDDTHVTNGMAFINALPENATMSLQRDIMQGRPSELEAWNGAVVRLAKAHPVEVPIHRVIYHSLLPQELRARGELLFV